MDKKGVDIEVFFLIQKLNDKSLLNKNRFSSSVKNFKLIDVNAYEQIYHSTIPEKK